MLSFKLDIIKRLYIYSLHIIAKYITYHIQETTLEDSQNQKVGIWTPFKLFWIKRKFSNFTWWLHWWTVNTNLPGKYICSAPIYGRETQSGEGLICAAESICYMTACVSDGEPWQLSQNVWSQHRNQNNKESNLVHMGLSKQSQWCKQRRTFHCPFSLFDVLVVTSCATSKMLVSCMCPL